jgi:hypothetical protein
MANTHNLTELPDLALLKIIQKLPLVDLFKLQQVNKHMYFIVEYYMRFYEKRVKLDHFNLYGYHKENNEMFYKEIRFRTFKKILSKYQHNNMIELDLEFLCRKRFVFYNKIPEMLQIITECFSKIEKLNLSGLLEFISYKSFPITSFYRMTLSLTQLREVNLSDWISISDSNVKVLIEQCPYLEHINLTGCFLINGEFLSTEKPMPKLKTLILNNCYYVKGFYLAKFFALNSLFIENLQLGKVRLELSVILIIMNDLTALKCLKMSGFGLDPFKDNLLEFDFRNLKLTDYLIELDLSNSNGDNRLFASILKYCIKLRKFDINSCRMITDEVFDLLTIRAPLEELNLNCVSSLTDFSLDFLIKNSQIIAKTLKILSIDNCLNITPYKIGNLLKKFNLNLLSMRNISISDPVITSALNKDHNIRFIGRKSDLSRLEYEFITIFNSIPKNSEENLTVLKLDNVIIENEEYAVQNSK